MLQQHLHLEPVKIISLKYNLTISTQSASQQPLITNLTLYYINPSGDTDEMNTPLRTAWYVL